jgi:hypothetical protein
MATDAADTHTEPAVDMRDEEPTVAWHEAMPAEQLAAMPAVELPEVMLVVERLAVMPAGQLAVDIVVVRHVAASVAAALAAVAVAVAPAAEAAADTGKLGVSAA